MPIKYGPTHDSYLKDVLHVAFNKLKTRDIFEDADIFYITLAKFQYDCPTRYINNDCYINNKLENIYFIVL